MLFSSFLLGLLPLASAFADAGLHERSRSRSRSHGNLSKRQTFSGRATFYDVGLGACGWYNSGGDYIVALNTAQYGDGYPGPNCGRSITISANGVQVQATIADQCPTCGYGDLDLSRGLFNRFASPDVGQFQMNWWYNDGNNPAPTTTQQQPTTTQAPPPPPPPPTSTSTYVPPTSTYTPPPPETSTWVAPSTTSTTPSPTPTPTSTSTSSSSTSTQISSTISSASSIISTSALSSAPAGITTNGTVLPFAVTSEVGNSTAPSSTASADPAAETDRVPTAQLGNLVLFNQAVTYLGNIVVVGAKEQMTK